MHSVYSVLCSLIGLVILKLDPFLMNNQSTHHAEHKAIVNTEVPCFKYLICDWTSSDATNIYPLICQLSRFVISFCCNISFLVCIKWFTSVKGSMENENIGEFVCFKVVQRLQSLDSFVNPPIPLYLNGSFISVKLAQLYASLIFS